MGLDRAKSLLEVRDGLSFLDVIARQVLWAREEYGVRLPLVFMDSFRTSDDTTQALAGYDLARRRAAAGLPAEQGAQAPGRRPDPGHVGGRPGPRVVPARPRRPLHRAARQRPARPAHRRRLHPGVRLQLRQPRRDPGPAGRRVVRPVRRPVRHRGGPSYPVGPQGRPLRPSYGGRPDRAARDRPDPRRGPGRARRPVPAPVLLHQQPVVRPGRDARRARPARRGARPGADQEHQDRRPRGLLEPRGDPDRVRDGRGRRGLRRRAARSR